MKKLLLILSAVLFSSILLAQYQATLRLGSTDVSPIFQGDIVSVPVYLDTITPGSLVPGFDFMFSYDHSVLEWYGSYTTYVGEELDWLFGDNEEAMFGVWFDPTFQGVSFDEDSILCEIFFEYIYTGGDTQLLFDTSSAYGFGPWFEITWIDGCVCSPVPNPITFHVTSGDTNLEDADVIIDNEIVTTNSSGNAVFYLLNGDYNYIVSKVGFEPQTASFTVAGAMQTIEIELMPLLVLELGNDTSLCMGDILLLDAGPGFDSYLWQDGSTAQTFAVDEAGEYWVHAWQGQSMYSDTINIYYWTYPDPDLGNDTTICFGASLVLQPQTSFIYYEWQDGSNQLFYVVTQPGVYYVTVIDMNGCMGSDTIWVDFANPVNLGPDTSIIITENLMLDAGEGFVSYTWQDGSTSQYYLVSSDSLGNGIFEFSVTVIDSIDCSSEDTIIVNILETSVFNSVQDFEFNIYPNPGKGKFCIEQKSNKASPLEIQIMDLTGKIVYSRSYKKAEEILVDLSEQQKGMYFIQLKSGQIVQNKKLIIQ